jgi:hypothetical protein
MAFAHLGQKQRKTHLALGGGGNMTTVICSEFTPTLRNMRSREPSRLIWKRPPDGHHRAGQPRVYKFGKAQEVCASQSEKGLTYNLQATPGRLIMAMRFENPASGYVEDISYAPIWCLLFGFVYFAAKGVWTHAVGGAVLAISTLWCGSFTRFSQIR